jgi:hypothetical protein
MATGRERALEAAEGVLAWQNGGEVLEAAFVADPETSFAALEVGENGGEVGFDGGAVAGFLIDYAGGDAGLLCAGGEEGIVFD